MVLTLDMYIKIKCLQPSQRGHIMIKNVKRKTTTQAMQQKFQCHSNKMKPISWNTILLVVTQPVKKIPRQLSNPQFPYHIH